LTKADIFSLGASIYELMINEDLPKNGEDWHRIRKGLSMSDFGKMNCKAFLNDDS
jgi:wee1-like protein kinase